MAAPLLTRPLALCPADCIRQRVDELAASFGARVLAGAVLGSFSYIHEYLIPFTRHTGPSLSPFNAWVLLKSLETMEMRVNRMCENAQQIAEFLETRKEVKSVKYPGLKSHPDYATVQKQMTGGGSTIGIEFVGSQKDAFATDEHGIRGEIRAGSVSDGRQRKSICDGITRNKNI